MEKEQLKTTVYFFLIFFLILIGNIMYWLAYYPGGFNLDAYGQWAQIHGDQPFNNWHPFFVTAVYLVLTKIIDSFSFCIFMQILLFSISLSLLLTKVGEVVEKRWISVVVAIIDSVNPAIAMNNISLVKDVYFTIGVILIEYLLLIMLFKDNIRHKKTWILLSITSLVLLLTRYNALFFMIPIIITMWVIYENYRRVIVKISLVIVGTVIIIVGPIYSFVGVRAHDNPKGEIVGIPMAIMANALVTDREHIPEDVEEYLLEMTDYDTWDERYVTGEWYSIKWEIGGPELLRDISIGRIVIMTLKTMIYCPEASLRSIICNTRLTWQVFGWVEWQTYIYIEDNPYGIFSCPNVSIIPVIDVINNFGNSFWGSTLIWNLGGYMVLLVWITYYMIKRKSKLIILCIPIISYVFFTTLLLSGPNYRYFYFVPILVIPISILFFAGKGRIQVE